MYDQGEVKIHLKLAHNCKLGVKSEKIRNNKFQHMKIESTLRFCQKQPFWEFS
jgi:hypothetical protein